jgi:uncharacterized protein YndB with AHSA1/START domain
MAITKHIYQTFIKATPEQVWEAIIEPGWTRRYFHHTAFDQPPVEGAPYRTSIDNGQPAVDGVIEVLDPPRRLVMTWHVLYDAAMAEEPPSRVEWLLDAVGDGLTRLRLEHGDLGLSPLTWANVKDGWFYVLDGLKTVVETGESLPPLSVSLEPVAVDANGDWHRIQGIESFNGTWSFIEQPDRTADDDEAMIQSAYASAYHWSKATGRTIANDARGQWILSRVHVLVGRGDTALYHARRCAAAVEAGGLDDFDLGYALEATARSLALLGRNAEAAPIRATAAAVPIADPEDRKIFESDLAGGPWFALDQP